MKNMIEKQIIDTLINKYEKSKSFSGNNKVSQAFAIKIHSVFPEYMDHSNFEEFQAINEAIDILNRKQLIVAKAGAGNVYSKVTLNLEALENAYLYIGRIPKKSVFEKVQVLLKKYQDRNLILHNYCLAQEERITNNQSIQFFQNDLTEYENILIAIDEVLKIDTEIYIRDFSVRIFRNSKVFDAISTKVVNLLFEYGDFPEKEQVLGNLNLVKNPTYVNFKGNGIIGLSTKIKNRLNDNKAVNSDITSMEENSSIECNNFGSSAPAKSKVSKDLQIIDLSRLSGDIAISSDMLQDIELIDIRGNSVITIENITSFHTFNETDMFAIYLGGYHNRIRRKFIRKIYEQNPDKTFYHFGDIDAGGFYILEHLKKQTGIDFKPYKMDLETLKQYYSYSKPLTENDKVRLQKLLNAQSDYKNVLSYMIENNCKLEQEAVNL